MVVFQYKKDGEWINIQNISRGYAKKQINGRGIIDITIDQPDATQYEYLVANTEIRVIDGEFSFYGVIRQTDGEAKLQINGSDYSYLCNKKMLEASSSSHADTSLSSGYTVVYTNTPGEDIISDIAVNCGLTTDSSSLDSFPNFNIRFRNVFGIEALKKMQKLTGGYWWIDETKKLHFKSSYGSSTETAAFNLNENAVLISKMTDDERRCTKAMVWGSGGSYGEYTDALYTSGEKYEGRFKFDELRTNTECSTRAQQIVEAFKENIFILTIQTGVKGYDLGDNVYVNGRNLSGTYRITSISAQSDGTRRLDLTNTGLDHRTESPEEVYEKLLSSANSNVSNITTGDSYDELIYNGQGAASTNHYAKIEVYIDPNKVSDVLDAQLYVVRNYIEKIYGDTTSSTTTGISQTDHDHSQNYFTQAGHDHSQNYFSQSSHDHSTNSITTPPAIDGGIDIRDNKWVWHRSSPAPTSWETITTFSNSYAGGTNGSDMWYVSVMITYEGDSSVSDWDTVHVRIHGGASTDYPTENSGSDYKAVVHKGHTVTMFIPIPVGWWNTSTSSIEIQWRAYGGGWNYRTQAYIWSTEGHRHYVDIGDTQGDYADFTSTNSTDGDYASFTAANSTDGDTANINDPGHTNPLSVDVKQYDDGASKTIGVYVDSTHVSDITLNSIGDDSTLDLSSYITTAGYHTVELRPNGNVYLSAGVRAKVFRIE